jgi:hypothetical protein
VKGRRSGEGSGSRPEDQGVGEWRQEVLWAEGTVAVMTGFEMPSVSGVPTPSVSPSDEGDELPIAAPAICRLPINEAS